MTKILLTNDDGIEAEGLASLAAALSEHAEVIVVAPQDHQSCCGHGVTTHKPLKVDERRPGWYAVNGLPTDCVRVGLLYLRLNPDWVISGINHGGNLGVDILMSGTVAAAREASLLGQKSVAISQYRHPAIEVPWSLSAARGVRAWTEIAARPLERLALWNINLPAVASRERGDIQNPANPTQAVNNRAIILDEDRNLELVDCHPEPMPLQFELQHGDEGILYRSNYQTRPRSDGTDVAICFGGKITCSKLSATHFYERAAVGS
jgi:5'-nucleotidase